MAGMMLVGRLGVTRPCRVCAPRWLLSRAGPAQAMREGPTKY